MPKMERAYKVGARPPQELSGKAKKQLSSAKPSRKAMSLVAKSLAAKVEIFQPGPVAVGKSDTTHHRPLKAK